MNELLEPPAAEPPAAGPQVLQLPRLPTCLTRRADGEVIITGTRVRAVAVFAAAAGGVQLDDMAETFPQVRPDRLAGVVAFRAAHLEAVDAYTRWRSERTGPSTARGVSDRGGRAQAPAGVSNATADPPPASAALAAPAEPVAHTQPDAPAASAPAPPGLLAPVEPAEPPQPAPAE